MLPKSSSIEDSPPGIGSLWIGDSLSRLERACIRQMLNMGHAVTLYSLGQIESVPDDVQQVDAREIIGNRKAFPWMGQTRFWGNRNHRFSGSYALFSDMFRYHMLTATDLIWVDLDVFLLRPLLCSPNGMGYYFVLNEKSRSQWLRKSIENGILRLPQNSQALQNLNEFCEDEYPVPPFCPSEQRVWLRILHILGMPKHVSRLRWGVWGPQALYYFLEKSGEIKYAFQSDRTWHRQIEELFKPHMEFKASLPTECDAIHLQGAGLRPRLQNQGIPSGSYIQWLLQQGD